MSGCFRGSRGDPESARLVAVGLELFDGPDPAGVGEIWLAGWPLNGVGHFIESVVSDLMDLAHAVKDDHGTVAEHHHVQAIASQADHADSRRWRLAGSKPERGDHLAD